MGYKLEAELTAMGVSTANDLRALPKASLVSSFGDRVGSYLYSACRGEASVPPWACNSQRSSSLKKVCKEYHAILEIYALT